MFGNLDSSVDNSDDFAITNTAPKVDEQQVRLPDSGTEIPEVSSKDDIIIESYDEKQKEETNAYRIRSNPCMEESATPWNTTDGASTTVATSGDDNLSHGREDEGGDKMGHTQTSSQPSKDPHDAKVTTVNATKIESDVAIVKLQAEPKTNDQTLSEVQTHHPKNTKVARIMENVCSIFPATLKLTTSKTTTPLENKTTRELETIDF